jgi:hypothetical protein
MDVVLIALDTKYFHFVTEFVLRKSLLSQRTLTDHRTAMVVDHDIIRNSSVTMVIELSLGSPPEYLLTGR